MAPRGALRPIRPPPKLRTKTGCLTCRGRRKKCDEAKPRCKACQRNWLECRWQPSVKTSCTLPKPQQLLLQDSDSFSNELTSSLSPISTETLLRVCVSEDEGLSDDYTVDKPSNSGSTTPCQELSLIEDGSDLEILGPLSNEPSPSLVYRPPGIQSTDDYAGIQYFIEKMGPYMVRAHSHPGFFDHSYIVGLALHNPGLMNSFLALSCVHRSARDEKYYPKAITHYNSAIRLLRDLINGQGLTGTEDWLLMMMDTFCLIERWNPRATNGPNVHLSALITVLKARYSKRGASLFSSQIHTFERAMAESVLYQSVVLSLYKQMDDAVIGDIFVHLNAAYSIDPFPDAPAWSNSPLLGSSPVLYLTIHRILKLRCSVPLQHQDRELAKRLYADLCNLSISSNHVGHSDIDEEDLAKMRACYETTQLFLIGAKIILLKLMNPQFDAGNARIQSHVEQALVILAPRQPPSFRYDQYLIWPLIVIGLACGRDEDISLVTTSLEKVWNNTHCGDAKRGQSLLRRATRKHECYFSSTHVHSSNHSSGLDMLICKDGVF